ncbi:MAG: type II methionyl aminopeptidase [Candidatus Diapherotrites archaeon]|nr:type II methionyl aminopeptidase [Candidatus Diapherotrites archaeon]
MEKSEIEKHLKAGEIAWEAQQEARKLLKPNSSLFEAAEKIEEFIIKKKALPAFPVNLSLNENAAHQTPCWNDKILLRDRDLLKVDIGVHIDGRIADCAFSINHDGKWASLIEASDLALKNAALLLEKNPSLGEIGAEIQKTIEGKGFKPVQNLTGHTLEEYVQHASPSIPNTERNDSNKLEENTAFAIEPFATNGEGMVRDGADSGIFEIEEPRAVRNAHARKVLEFAAENYRTLPFAERWLAREMKLSEFELKIGLKHLLREKCIRAFPVLKERKDAMVSQAENSFIKSENKILTIIKPGKKETGTGKKTG